MPRFLTSAEAKDAYLPVGQLSASLSLTDDLTLVGFWQYQWEETLLNPVGDFFGSDYFGPGAQFYRLAPGVIGNLPDQSFRVVNYAGEVEPDDDGQWGLGLRYQLNVNTEVGLYHYRYHDRVAALFFDFTGDTQYSSLKNVGRGTGAGNAPAFQLGYFDDIALQDTEVLAQESLTTLDSSGVFTFAPGQFDPDRDFLLDNELRQKRAQQNRAARAKLAEQAQLVNTEEFPGQRLVRENFETALVIKVTAER